MNSQKPSGRDKIPAHLLKEITLNYLQPARCYFKHPSLSEISVGWHHGFRTLLFKKGDRCNTEICWPISLTSINSELLEYIMYGAVIEHFERLKILNNAQHGFLKCR